MRHRPVILVTGPDRGGWPAWWFTALALRRAGARPRRITPRRHRDGETPFADGRAQGLVLGGGSDISPTEYGDQAIDEIRELSRDRRRRRFGAWLFDFTLGLLIGLVRWLFASIVGKNAGIDHERDRCEGALLEDALLTGAPVLGICRGAQLINVRRGGSLHRDLTNHYDETTRVNTVYPRKHINIVPGTRLHDLLGADRTRVNSLHRQAVDRLGSGLGISAREDNGVIQAIESTGDNNFLVGVQWHPEYLPQIGCQQEIFRALATAARRSGERAHGDRA